MFACLVRRKGLGDETAVKTLTKVVDLWGYRKLVIETDCEPVLVAVQETVVRKMINKTLCENPPAYDAQADGFVEHAV